MNMDEFVAKHVERRGVQGPYRRLQGGRRGGGLGDGDQRRRRRGRAVPAGFVKTVEEVWAEISRGRLRARSLTPRRRPWSSLTPRRGKRLAGHAGRDNAGELPGQGRRRRPGISRRPHGQGQAPAAVDMVLAGPMTPMQQGHQITAAPVMFQMAPPCTR
jgi:hypothetical protein